MSAMLDIIINFGDKTHEASALAYHAFANWPSYWHVVFVSILLLFAFVCWKWRFVKRLNFMVLNIAAIGVFLFGGSVYTVGALQTDGSSVWDAIYTVPSAIISSLGMFVYQDDISELSENAKNDNFFMAMYSLAHFLAALITSFVLIRLIGMRLFYWIEITCRSIFGCKRRDIYVFWSINPRSVTLAESIKQSCQGSWIVFVNTIEADDEEREVSVHTLFDVIKIKKEADNRICNMKAMMVNCHERLTSHCTEDADFFSLLRQMRLTGLARLLRRRASNIHLFFLSNDMDNNISNMEALVNVRMPNERSQKVHLYCHARHSAKTRWAEIKDVCNYGQNPHIHIVDSSYLSVFCLKENVEHHPINFVGIDNETATVTTPFHSMIIGFGETGEEAFKFLYEFGAFVDREGNKTEFRCTIVDQKISELEGLIYAKAPAMKEEADEGTLAFKECSINSVEYWHLVEKEVKNGLNYLVIAIADEELAIDTAANICTLATQWRDDNSPKLSVYVRSYNPDNYGRLKSVADVLNGKIGGIRLEIFGRTEDIFRYDVIVENKYVQQAMRYDYVYDCVANGNAVGQMNKETLESQWASLHQFTDPQKMKEKYKYQDKEGKDIWNVEEIERKRDQNICNALHAATKWKLLTAYPDHDSEYWRKKELTRETKVDKDGKTLWTPIYNNGTLSDHDKTVLMNVARCEHERWIAASRVQGQKRAEEKSVRYKRHTDLVPWTDLRPHDEIEKLRTQGYDSAVVDTTIQLFTTMTDISPQR